MTQRETVCHLAAIFLTALLAWWLPLIHWDDAVTALYFDDQRRIFPLRDAWLFKTLLHDVAKQLPVLVALALLAGLVLSLYRPERRWQLRPFCYALLVLVIGTAACGALKDTMPIYCPWNIEQFGGDQPHYALASFLSGLIPADVPAGHCWPSGHAAGAFGLLGLYFAARAARLPWAIWLLPGVLLFGALLGWAQVVRGAHFLSHVLWSLVICWAVALALSPLAGNREST